MTNDDAAWWKATADRTLRYNATRLAGANPTPAKFAEALARARSARPDLVEMLATGRPHLDRRRAGEVIADRAAAKVKSGEARTLSEATRIVVREDPALARDYA
jgi:hypothetical protein